MLKITYFIIALDEMRELRENIHYVFIVKATRALFIRHFYRSAKMYALTMSTELERYESVRLTDGI